MVENTKKYICKAMVTVVDHLGSASANLDNLIEGGVDSSPTDLRIDSLKQVSILNKLFICIIIIIFLSLVRSHIIKLRMQHVGLTLASVPSHTQL